MQRNTFVTKTGKHGDKVGSQVLVVVSSSIEGHMLFIFLTDCCQSSAPAATSVSYE
jgi:hypothetical protein